MEKRDKRYDGAATAGPRAVSGILNQPPPKAEEFSLWRFTPTAELAEIVEYYWMVQWDLRGRPPHTQETLPHPNIHVVFEPEASRVFGVVTGKFSRKLEGKSHVFGIRFAPGMFRSYLGDAVSSLTDKTKPVRDVFGPEVAELQSKLALPSNSQEMVTATDFFLSARIPPFDERAQLAKSLVRQILQDRELRTVDELVASAGMGKRTLQRLFEEYVGASPKWVIRRYRLQEAVDLVRKGGRANFAQIAADLGYFDQAHLINDFQSILGYSPSGFRTVS